MPPVFLLSNSFLPTRQKSLLFVLADKACMGAPLAEA